MKTKKLSKETIIKSLRRELETVREVGLQWQKKYQDLDNADYEKRKKLTRILSGRSEDFYPYSREVETKEWHNILSAITDLRGQVYMQGMIIPGIERCIFDENSKLWHLMRIIVRDKSLEKPEEEPRDFRRDEPLFGKPKFNN